jgi:hypothetical protein
MGMAFGHSPQNTMRLLVLTITLLVNCFTAQAILVVIPASRAETEGDSGWGIPFGFNLQVTRLQQVYDSSRFSFLGTNGGYINDIGFRLNIVYPWSYSGVVSIPLTVIVSTTTNSVGNLNAAFAQNTGSNQVTVYSGTFPFKALALPGVVEPFAMVIPFNTPFFYNPTEGNLLVDIVSGLIDESTGPVILDMEINAGNFISSSWAMNAPNSLNLPTNGTAQTGGLVTQFTFASTAINPPLIILSSLSSTNMVVKGTNGVPGAIFSLLSSTNLDITLSNWSSFSNNAFDQNGAFSLTNAFTNNSTQRFYKVKFQ